MEGFITLSRNIVEWEWYSDMKTKTVFLHCLIKANWKDGRFQGKEVPRGSFVSSYSHLAAELQMSVDEVRTCIKHLVETGELTKQSTSKFTVFTVQNYSKYQDVPKQIPSESQADTKQIPSESQANPKHFPTIEQSNNNNQATKQQGNNSNKGTFKPPTLTEVQEYIFQNNYNIKADRFIDYYQSNGWKVGRNPMKDWKAAVRQWATREKQYTKPDITDRTGAVDTWVERYGQRETNSPFS